MSSNMAVSWNGELFATATAALAVSLAGAGFSFSYSRAAEVKDAAGAWMRVSAAGALIWALIAFSVAFAPGLPTNVIGGVNFATIQKLNGAISYYVVESGAFALAAAALISGAVAHRYEGKHFVFILALWILCVYAPQAYWFMAGGWARAYEILDSAGGLTVHCTAGISALVLGVLAGGKDESRAVRPLPAVLAAVLGSFFLNAGVALSTSSQPATSAPLALLNTQIAFATGVASWFLLETALGGLLAGRKAFGEGSLEGAARGAMVGLAATASGAGFILPMWTVLISFVATVFVFLAQAASRRVSISGWDVFLVHFLGGAVGVACTGLFAQENLGAAAPGSFMFNAPQLGKACAGISAIILMSSVATACVWLVVKAVARYVFQSKVEA